MGIGCSKGTCCLQVKDGTKPYQAPQRQVAHMLQQPFKDVLGHSQKQQIIVPLGVHKTSE